MKKITVLIPTFNSAATIEETLNSIVANIDLKKYISTIYIADDFSNDQTINLCLSSWNVLGIELKIIRSAQNNGERLNVNNAINSIKEHYDWILLIHADDIAKPNWAMTLCEQINQCKENTASISSSYDVLLENGKIEVGENKLGYVVIEGKAENIKNTLINGTWWHISGCAINISIFETTGRFHPKMPQYGDMEWLIRSLKLKYDFVYIPQSLTIYRQHQASVSSNSFKRHLDIYEHSLLIKENLNYLNKEELRLLLLRFHKMLLRRAVSSIVKINFNRFLSAIKMSMTLKKQFKN